MLSSNLLLLDQLKFLLNVFILIPLQSQLPVLYIFIYKPTQWAQSRLKNGKKMIIAESFRAVGGAASDLLHDFVQGGAS